MTPATLTWRGPKSLLRYGRRRYTTYIVPNLGKGRLTGLVESCFSASFVEGHLVSCPSGLREWTRL